MFGAFCVFCVFYNHSFLDFDYTLSRGHPIALNRTHVMILQVEIFSQCLYGWVYSFISFKWNGVNQCIYQLNNTDVDIKVDPCQKINSSKVDFQLEQILECKTNCGGFGCLESYYESNQKNYFLISK